MKLQGWVQALPGGRMKKNPSNEFVS